MNALASLLAVILPQLIQYFTKNDGLNTVTGAAGGSLLTLVLLGMEPSGFDQIITFLQNYSERCYRSCDHGRSSRGGAGVQSFRNTEAVIQVEIDTG